MLLQVMPFPGDVRNCRLARAQLDPSDFSHGRVGLLGFGRVDFGADGFLLVALLQEGGFGEFGELFTGASGDCMTEARERERLNGRLSSGSNHPEMWWTKGSPWLMVALTALDAEKFLLDKREGPAMQVAVEEDRSARPLKADRSDLEIDMIKLIALPSRLM